MHCIWTFEFILMSDLIYSHTLQATSSPKQTKSGKWIKCCCCLSKLNIFKSFRFRSTWRSATGTEPPCIGKNIRKLWWRLVGTERYRATRFVYSHCALKRNGKLILLSIAERSFLATIAAVISGFMVSVTLLLFKMSRNYRYVTKVLAKEKKDLKVSSRIRRVTLRLNLRWRSFSIWQFYRPKKILDKGTELALVTCGHHCLRFCELEGMLNDSFVEFRTVYRYGFVNKFRKHMRSEHVNDIIGNWLNFVVPLAHINSYSKHFILFPPCNYLTCSSYSLLTACQI